MNDFVVFKESLNDFNRIADSFIVIEHSPFNSDGASLSGTIIRALEEESRVKLVKLESLYEKAADIAYEYEILLVSAEENCDKNDVDSDFEAALKSSGLFPVPSKSTLSSKLNVGAFCCLFYFLIFLENVSFTKLSGSNFELASLSDRYGLECKIDATEFLAYFVRTSLVTRPRFQRNAYKLADSLVQWRRIFHENILNIELNEPKHSFF
jgi:hypothetical protein